MRRSAVLECLKQEAELLVGLFLGDAQHIEHTGLDVVTMDTNGTAAHLLAVADDVVGVGHGVFGILVELVDPILARHGERMMHSCETVFLLAPLKKREFCYPYETVFVLVKKVHLFCKLKTKCSQYIVYKFSRCV